MNQSLPLRTPIFYQPGPDIWTRYSGFEEGSALPPGLRENQARQFMMALCRFQDRLNDPGDLKPAFDRVKTHLLLNDRDAWSKFYGTTIGHFLATTPNKICEYMDYNPQREQGRLTAAELETVGIIRTPIQPNPKKPFRGYGYKVTGPLVDVMRRLDQFDGLSYLGLIDFWLARSKPQYSQPMLMHVGEMLEDLMAKQKDNPEILEDLQEIRRAFKKSGFDKASQDIQNLCITNQRAR